MSSLPPPVAEAAPPRASVLSTYLASRIVIALCLTGLDGLVFVKSVLQGFRNSFGMPVLHWLLIAASIGLAMSLANVWYKALRYRRPSQPSRNPFL